MTPVRKYNDKTVVDIMKLLIKGLNYQEIQTELKISRHVFDTSLASARKQYEFKTTYQLLADYVKHQWWPGEAEKSGTWDVLKDRYKVLDEKNSIMSCRDLNSLTVDLA